MSSRLTWEIADYLTLDNADVADKLVQWLRGNAGGLGARRAQSPSLAISCRLFQDVDMLTFLPG